DESPPDAGNPEQAPHPSPLEALTTLLAHPNIASKHWIVRQYDHEVQGATTLRPLVGPLGRGPGDASVVEPVPGSDRALAIGCGLATGVGDPDAAGDPYLMALGAIDECVRNLVCVGADPDRIAILDNFCWPSCQREDNLATLVRAAEGCYDAAKAYRTPFVSGKDSLNNQFTTESGRTIQIPPTLLITGIGIVPDLNRCVTMDAKQTDSDLFLVEPWQGDAMYNPSRLGGSHYQRLFGLPADARPNPDCGFDPAQIPAVDLNQCPRVARAVAEAIACGAVAACHDISDGGPLVALAEMLIAGSTRQRPIGATFAQRIATPALFSERPGCYLLEVPRPHVSRFKDLMARLEAGATWVGRTTDSGRLESRGTRDDSIDVEELATAWRGTLDW
ncbi:MAG: AIR synthase-related protein, partial [Phycisphaerales bacterium JB059]